MGTTQTGRRRQSKSGSDPIKVIRHLQVGIIDDIVDAIGPTQAQRRDTGGGQIVSVNVIAIDVVGRDQRRQTFLQALERQAVGSINARRPQDADSDTIQPSPAAQAIFGVDAPRRPGTFRMSAPGFVNSGTCAIAIDACRTNVNQPAW